MTASSDISEKVVESGHHLKAPTNIERIEAPVTLKAYFLCAFASFGGIFFGYDSGYINGVTGSKVFIELIEGAGATALSAPHNSLITSILSCGTFFGAVAAGDVANYMGRRATVIMGCAIYMAGCILQAAANNLGLLVGGRLIAGSGVGLVSAIIILYMSEIAPKAIRGSLISGYQFSLTVGILLAACINYGVQDLTTSASYKIPICIQFAWGLILAIGLLFLLPESPRHYVNRHNFDAARKALCRVRGQPLDSVYVEQELAEIIANSEYERQLMPESGYWATWTQCLSGSMSSPASNIRRTFVGTSLQALSQLSGINFIFYFSTPFLESTGAIKNPFIISLIFTLVNVLSTPVSFYTIDKLGRRPVLLFGAIGMTVCQILVASIGVTIGFNKTHINELGVSVPNSIAAVNAQIAFIAIYIFCFATSWGPCGWVTISEIYPLPIRARGVSLSVASNWLWNTIIAVITPYLVNENEAYLRSSTFFLWGGWCLVAIAFTYFFVPETKGLSLEQVDRMLEETNARCSSKWKPTTTFATEADMVDSHGNLKDRPFHKEIA